MTPAVLRGHVYAAALLFDPALIGEEEARRRIIALWSPGAAVLRCGPAYVLRLAKPQMMAAARAPGLPLVRRGSALAGFDLDARVLAELGPFRDPTVIRYESGTMTIVQLMENVEPADWLDLSAATVVRTAALGALPPPPEIATPIEEQDLRELLNVPPLAEADSLTKLLDALRGRPQTGGAGGGAGAGGTGAAGGTASGRFVPLFLLLLFVVSLFLIAGAFHQSSTPAASNPASTHGVPVPAHAAAPVFGNVVLAVLLACGVLLVAFLHRPTREALAAAAFAIAGGVARLLSLLGTALGAVFVGGRGARESTQGASVRPSAPPARPASDGRQSSIGCTQPLLLLVVVSIIARAAAADDMPAVGMLVIAAVLIGLFIRRALGRTSGTQVTRPVSSKSASGPSGRAQDEAESILRQLRAETAGASRWRAAVSRFLALTRLSSLVGRAQAKYLIKMLEMFEENDLDAALRHAIPLAGDGASSSGAAWGMPSPRATLSLSMGPSGTGPAYAFGVQLYDELKRRYRAAFERLDQARRYDEAAFVLAELLRSNEEAVAYLEKRGELRKAAQLAEARGLAPDLIVRQWMIAGDPRRAIALAKRYGAFGPAVTRLEATHPETARALRGHWGAWLADGGHYSAAVDVVWSVGALRGVATAWIDRAIEQGGAVAGRMLVRRANVRPEVRPETMAMLFELLASEGPQRLAARSGAGAALLSDLLRPDLRIVARAAIRAAMRDTPYGLDADQIRRLAQHAHQNPLRADLPALPRAETWNRNAFVEVVCEAADSGALPVYAIASLTDGRVAVALGEAGVRVLSRDGRRVAHFDQPANDLVISDARDRAIAVIRRGGILRLARIDFAARTAAYWCDADLGMYARDYDGASWFAARGREILQLDATVPRLEALWHNPDFPALVTWLARDEKQLCVLGRGEKVQRWRYELPLMTLRERDEIDMSASAIYAVVSPAGSIFAADAERGLVLRGKDLKVLRGNETTAVFADRGGMVPRFAGNWLVAEARAEERCDIYLCEVDGTPRAHFAFEGTSRVAISKQPGSLALADDRGRVLALDLRRGLITHNLRT